MNIEELRIGSIVVEKVNNKIIRLCSISDDGHVTYKNEHKISIQLKQDDIEPLFLSDDILKQIIKQGVIQKAVRKKGLYNFPNKLSTFFLVYHQVDKNYFIGMTDTKLPEKYRRISRPFLEYHKLQNAYNTIYDSELKWLNI